MAEPPYSAVTELRTEWLRLKGCLFDANTQLPSLPAVTDDVRRQLEDGERVGLIYLDLSSDKRFEATNGWQAYDRMLEGVADALRASPPGLINKRDTLALVSVRSDQFVIFVGLGNTDTDAFEHRHQALVAHVNHVLSADLKNLIHRLPPLQSAAGLIELEPTVRIERSIYTCLQRLCDQCRRQTERRETGRLAELLRILTQRSVIIRYQPIVQLHNGMIHGFEALGAPPTDDTFESPERMFSYAEKTDRIIDLERLCRGEALRRVPGLTGTMGGKVFLNCSVHAFHDPELVTGVVEDAHRVGLAPCDVVLEVTERVAIPEWRSFRRAIDDVRAAGLRIAIDDVGSGYSSLHTVAELEPDYLKFDLSLILNIHESRIKRNLLESLVNLADKIGAQPVAEGLERQEEFQTVRELGVTLGQGYLFARPAEPSQLGPIHFPTA